MKRIPVWCIFLMSLVPLCGLASEKNYRFGQISIEKDTLKINFQVFDLFNKEMLQGLQKGMTAAIEYQIQIWRERPRWVDQLIAERIIRRKVNFDQWEKRYVLATSPEEQQFMSEHRIRERCSQLVDIPIVPSSKLTIGDQYIIAMKIVIQPMSVENYQEIRRWLAGEVKEINPKAIRTTKSPGKKAGNWLLGLVLNLTGFGDRIITAKSPSFVWQDEAVTFDNEE